MPSPDQQGQSDFLFVTAIDHRVDFVKELVGAAGKSPAAADLERAAQLKGIVFAGLAAAVEAGLPKSQTAVWAEPELGEAVLLRGRGMSMPTIASVERPGSPHFQLQNVLGFTERLKKLGASFAGARIIHTVDSDITEKQSQLQTLRRLSEVSRSEGPPLLLELMHSPRAPETGDITEPEGLLEALRDLQDAGVEPAIWVFDAPASKKMAAALAAQAHLDDRNGLRVLFMIGQDPNESIGTAAQEKMITLAARTPGVGGILIGPGAFSQALRDYDAGKIGREEAVERIADAVGSIGKKFIDALSTSDVS
jgi:myo-inositol catabolism protein IolC